MKLCVNKVNSTTFGLCIALEFIMKRIRITLTHPYIHLAIKSKYYLVIYYHARTTTGIKPNRLSQMSSRFVYNMENSI